MEKLTWKDILLHCTQQVLKLPSLNTEEPGDSERDISGLLQQFPTFLAPQTSFMEDRQFLHGLRVGEDGFWMIQAHYNYSALYF